MTSMEGCVEFGYKLSTCSGRGGELKIFFRVSCKMIHNVQVLFCSVLSCVRRSVKFSVPSLRPLVVSDKNSIKLKMRNRHCMYLCMCFDVLLTVHLSIILATDQLNAQILVL